MGNCMETCIHKAEVEERQVHELQQTVDNTSEDIKENGTEKKNMRVKVVLTKEELEWLLLQLKHSEEKSKLEEFLGEIERRRGRASSGWKPSLESIIESPEVPEMMDRS